MNKILPEIFEKFLNTGIHAQYSEKSQKLYICAMHSEDINKIYEIIKKYKVRLSFVDSPNPQIIFEYRPINQNIKINNKSQLCEVDSEYNILKAEKYLNSEGFSLGYYFPPILNNPQYKFRDWISNYHIPAMNYYQSDLASNIRGVDGILPDGRRYSSICAPRMATGSDTNRLLILAGSNLFYPISLNLKIIPIRTDLQIISFSCIRIKNLFSAIASLATKNIRLEFVALYTGNEENSESILHIGYKKNEIFDFKSWIIRTVNNEGVHLINSTIDYNSIRDILFQYTNRTNQIEFLVRYKGIGKFEEILKMLSTNFRIEGYLYRYERNSFSFRVILPENTYQLTRDELMAEISKYSKDISLIDCKEGKSTLIPLSIYSRIIHSCSS